MTQFLLGIIFSLQAMAQSQEAMEKDLVANPNHLSTRIRLANAYLQNARAQKVIDLLNSYTDQLPAPGFLALASAYSTREDYSNETRVLNLLVSKDNENFQWHVLLGQAFIKQASVTKDSEKRKDLEVSAIQHLRRCLALNPTYKAGFNILMTTLLQMKANNEARELINEGIGKFGNRPELFRELCRLDSNDGFLDQAVTNCRTAIQLAPQYPDNYVFLVQALGDQGEDKLAETDIVSAAKKFPKSEFIQWAAGMMYLKKKNWPVAGRYFNSALAADGTAGRSHFGLAQAQFEIGDDIKALPHFIKACQEDAKTIDTFLAAGGRLKQKGKQKLGEEFVHHASVCAERSRYSLRVTPQQLGF